MKITVMIIVFDCELYILVTCTRWRYATIRLTCGSLIKVKYWMSLECRPIDSQRRLYLQGQIMQLPTVIILRNYLLHNCFSNEVSKPSIICGNIAWFMNYFLIAEALHSCVSSQEIRKWRRSATGPEEIFHFIRIQFMIICYECLPEHVYMSQLAQLATPVYCTPRGHNLSLG